MKKLLLILSLCFCFVIGNTQVIINRTTGTNTVNDPRLMASRNLFIPRYADTTAANVQKGIDTCGAIIFTYDANSLWLRACSPKRWASIAANISTFNFLTDSSIVICFGSGVCDTIDIGGDISTFLNFTNIYNNSVTGITLINGDSCAVINTGGGAHTDTVCVNFVITNFSFLNDSTLILCDSLDVNGVQICDTVNITPHPLFISQNWIRNPTPGIWEFGSNTPFFSNGLYLDHNTYTNTNYYKMTWGQNTIFDYGHQFEKNVSFPNGTGITDWLHTNCCQATVQGTNTVRLGVNFTSHPYQASGPFIPGYFPPWKGYWIGTNITGNGSFGLNQDDQTAKTVGFFWHTNDTANTIGVSIYARPPSVGTYLSGMENYIIADFTTDKYSLFHGRVELDTALATAANNLVLTNGNVFTVSGSTQINAITTSGWQAGSTVILIFSGAPTVKHNTAGGAGTAPIILAGATDFAASANDVLTLSYNGTNWYETTRKLAAFAPSIRFGVSGEDNTAAQTRIFTTGTNFFEIARGNTASSGFSIQSTGTSSAQVIFGDNNDTNPGVDGVGTTRLIMEHTTTADGGPFGYFNFRLRNSDSSLILNGVSNSFRSLLPNVYWNNIPNATASNILYYDPSTKKMSYGTLAASAYPTLQQVFNTEVGGSVLTKLDSIQAGSFGIRGYATGANTLLDLNNSGTGYVITATSTNTGAFATISSTSSGNTIAGYFDATGAFGKGLYGKATGGQGVFGDATTGTGGQFQSTNGGTGIAVSTVGGTYAATFLSTQSSTNTSTRLIRLEKQTSGTPGDGIGGYVEFMTQTSFGGRVSGEIHSLFSTVNDATRTSKMVFTGVNSGTTGNKLILNGSGLVNFPPYGSGTFTGTPTHGLSVTSSGDVIETNTGLTGLYEPSSYNVTNVSASTPNGFTKYYRVGDMVTVYGSMTVDPTSTGATEVDLDLPFASNLTRADDCVGSAGSTNITGEILVITGDTTNDRVQISWSATDTSNRTIYFHFSYQVK